MIDELISKLNTAFSEQLSKECQVVFILSKTRKLIEREVLDEAFPLLKRYTDWALHIEIVRTAPFRSILQEIENTILSNEYNASPVFEIINFIEFKKQFIELLERYNIQNKLSENEYWRNFRNLFIDTLTDCPLKPDLKEMTEFSFKRSNLDTINYEIKFRNHDPINGSFDMVGC